MFPSHIEETSLMKSFSRTAKLSSVAAIAAAMFLVLFSPSVEFSRSSASQDEKKNVVKVPPTKDKGSADKKDDPDPGLKKFMRQKLHASNQILEGLCTEDLQMVSEGSDTLMKMSGEEQWRVSNDIMYRRYSTEFIHAVEELQKEAEDNDMNGTSLAWVNVTMKCLKCHEWVRNTILVDSDK